MHPPCALLSLFLVTWMAVDASPLDANASKRALGFSTKRHDGGALAIVEKDRARAQAMQRAAHLRKRDTSDSSISAINAGITYIAKVGIGSPQTLYDLIIDTGSANTWVGASRPYAETSTSINTGHSVTEGYDSGNFTGTEWIDTLTLTPDLVVCEQSIGVANSSFGISPFDGILGLGPAGLTNHTVTDEGTIPTVMDNLFSQGKISEEVLGVYYVPFCEFNSTGELTFGGYDESVITSPIVYTPLTTKALPSFFWGIDLSVSYGSDTIVSSGGGVIDTGTTLIGLGSSAFKAYQAKTGAELDNATQLLKLSPDQYDQLESLMFYIGGEPFKLTPNAQVLPHSLTGDPEGIYLAIMDLGDLFPLLGLDVIVGYTFLERYYSIYDTTNKRVGFAQTDNTDFDCNFFL